MRSFVIYVQGHLSHKNPSAVEAVGGMPFVPFKPNPLEPTKAVAWARMCQSKEANV